MPETPDIKKLKAYNSYMDHVRVVRNPKMKYTYFFLYNFIIPVLRPVAAVYRMFTNKHTPQKCDVLVLGTCREDILGSREVWKNLREQGLTVEEYFSEKKTELFRYPFMTRLSYPCPSRLFLHASFAHYLTEKYKPQLLCIYHSSDVLPSLLRFEMKNIGKTVYIPHTIIPNRYAYTSVDFDYYLVFGQSSLENLNSHKLRFGSTQAIKVGSPRVQVTDRLERSEGNLLLFLSNWAIGKDTDYTRDFLIVRDWARKFPERKLLIKFHPLEDETFVKNELKDIDNVEFLDKSISLKDALAKVAMVITGFSAASVEAAMMNRPSVIANFREKNEESEDMRVSDAFLKMEDHFTPRARTPEELEERIKETFNSYDHYVKCCSEFVRYHLEYTTDSATHTVRVLMQILVGNVEVAVLPISEKLDGIEQKSYVL